MFEIAAMIYTYGTFLARSKSNLTMSALGTIIKRTLTRISSRTSLEVVVTSRILPKIPHRFARHLSSHPYGTSHSCSQPTSFTNTPAVQLSHQRLTPSRHCGCSHHTSQSHSRKHKKVKGHQTVSEPEDRKSDDADDESEWDEILSQEDRIDDLDPPPLGGHRFLVLQPDLKVKGTKHGQSTPQLQLEESVALIETIQDWTVVESLIQGVREPAKKSVFGKGTHARLTEMIRLRPEITAVFLSLEKLTALQQKELEEAWGVRLYDRYAVVLKIFKDHAHTREAKMQIALAEIPYLRSRLRNESSSMDQQRGGHSFISGGGETYLTIQQRVLKEREQKVRRALDQLRKKRGVLRSGRVRKNYPVVSVVGYTNAGKTTLIKALTGDGTMQPKDQLFATLDVTAHGGTLPNRMPVIYMDTVGFISALPHNLVASFAATLEDVLLSDVIVHVRDVSHPDTVSQKQNVLQVLTELGMSHTLMDTMIEVCNKMDKLNDDTELETSGFMVSAEKGTGLDKLKDCIQDRLMEATDIVPCQMEIPMSGPHLSWLYKEATITSTEAVGPGDDVQTMKVNVIMSATAFAKFRAKFGDLRVNSKG